MSILGDREDQPIRATALIRVVTMGALHDAPAVIAAGNDQIHLLPLVLTDIGQPQHAGFTVERKPPGIPDPEGKDFRSSSACDKRITFRNGIGLFMIHVDTENLPQPFMRILGAVLRIPARPAVATPDV